jgi:hypothetical protein
MIGASFADFLSDMSAHTTTEVASEKSLDKS